MVPSGVPASKGAQHFMAWYAYLSRVKPSVSGAIMEALQCDKLDGSVGNTLTPRCESFDGVIRLFITCLLVVQAWKLFNVTSSMAL